MLGKYGTHGEVSRGTGEIIPTYLTGAIVGYLDVMQRYDYAKRHLWEGDDIDPKQRIVRIGHYEEAQFGPHPFDDFAPSHDEQFTARYNSKTGRVEPI